MTDPNKFANIFTAKRHTLCVEDRMSGFLNKLKLPTIMLTTVDEIKCK